jgi:hypothetical protein
MATSGASAVVAGTPRVKPVQIKGFAAFQKGSVLAREAHEEGAPRGAVEVWVTG